MSPGRRIFAARQGVKKRRDLCTRLVFEALEDRRLLAGTSTQVGHFETWDGGVIRSTDVAGITYHPPSGHLYLADSEINELPEIFNGDNIFESLFPIQLSSKLVFPRVRTTRKKNRPAAGGWQRPISS